VGRILLYYGLLLIVLLLAFQPFGDMLGHYFTKTETGGVLHSARIESVGDFVRIVTSSIKSRFNPRAIYFRPSMTLSFSLDYALWGFHPMGYQLTDLLLHMGVAGFLFRVVYLFNGRDVWAGALAGSIYTLHPILVEVVPAVVHRQESLMACFLLLGLWAFYRREYEGGGRIVLAVALASFVAAVGGKESGIIFLPLVLVHLWIYNPTGRTTRVERLAATLRRGIPYLVTAGLYVGWWAYVTRYRALVGGGKTFKRPILRGSWWKSLYEQLYVFPARSIPFYFHALVSPFDALYERFGALLRVSGLTRLATGYFTGSSPGVTAVAWLLVLTVAVLGLRRWRRLPPSSGEGGMFAWERIPDLVLFGALLGLAGFPLYFSVIREMIARSYHGEGFAWLTALMESRERIALSGYVARARFRLLGLLVAAGVGALLVRSIYGRGLTSAVRGMSRWVEKTLGPRKPLAFHTAWLMIPALFYSITNIRSFKHSYHGVVPLAALGATLAVGSLRSIGDVLAGNREQSSFASGALPFLTGLTSTLVAGLVLIHLALLVNVSPLLVDYPAWDHGQRVTRQYHRMLLYQLEQLPPGSTVDLEGIPWWTGKSRDFPHFHLISPAMHPKPWVWMHLEGRDITVRKVGLTSFPEPCPCHLWLEKRQLGSHSFSFVTHPGWRVARE